MESRREYRKKEDAVIKKQDCFRGLVTQKRLQKPLQLPGVTNACIALLAQQSGFKALYLSGAGIANSRGLPDLGLTTFTEVSDEIRKIVERVPLPLLVDGDTGWGSSLTIQRMVQEFSAAGAAAVHIEDQVFPKRCGHRPEVKLTSQCEMNDRLKAALDARINTDFWIVARTDAAANEGIESALERSLSYQETGADMIFVEAISKLEDYQLFTKTLTVPILANMTEFGKTPLYTLNEFHSVGVNVVLYPLSGFRAMNKAAELVFNSIIKNGTQSEVLDKMQTREELYELLDYYRYEKMDTRN